VNRSRICSILFVLIGTLVLWLVWVGSAQADEIQVTTTDQEVNSDGDCSLQEAIYAANFDDNVAIDPYDLSGPRIPTGCTPGNGDDTIVLAPNAVYQMIGVVEDQFSVAGLSANPDITSTITIEGNGARLKRATSQDIRAFVVNYAPGEAGNPHGDLRLYNLHIKGFAARGGDGADGGGGGLGAGGAIYVRGADLIVEDCTFEANTATGGDGSSIAANGRGGGGGLGGDGGAGSVGGGGGGGGGSRGSGGAGSPDGGGGGGGGTANDGADGTAVGGNGGFACGGTGGDYGNPGGNGFCTGGGGGGGGFVNNGGDGAYGGGGGGLQNGGTGGFGGGGGGGSLDGGDGGFGAGGGGGGQNGGSGGLYGGLGGDEDGGGGGAGLGAAIFSDGGYVYLYNSTFYSNTTVAGAATSPAQPGQNGGVVFSYNGWLEVYHCTFSDSTGEDIMVVVDDESSRSFTLENTILANSVSAPANCTIRSYESGSVSVTSSGNLIEVDDTGGRACGGVASTANPQLGPLQLNWPGNTPTMAISAGSPALDTADNGYCYPNDQRGVIRPQGPGCDIGAFEAIYVDLAVYKSCYAAAGGGGLALLDAVGGDVVLAGEQWICDISVSNRSISDTVDLTLTDTLPSGLTYVASTVASDANGLGGAAAICGPTPLQGPGELTCTGIDVPASSGVSFRLAFVVSPAFVAANACGELPLVNRACALPEGVIDVDPSDNCSSATSLVKDSADLRVTKVSKPDDEVRAGENFTYTVYVDNLGPSYARGVRLTDQTISSTPFQVVAVIDDPDRTDSCVITPTYGTQTGQSTIDCTLLDANPGGGGSNDALEPVGNPVHPPPVPNTGRWKIVVVMRAEDTGDLDDDVRVFTQGTEPDTPTCLSGTPDPDTSNNQALDFISITDVADLEITKHAVGEVQVSGQPGLLFDITTPGTPFPQAPTYTTSLMDVTVGRRIRYTLAVTNTGPSDAENVVVTDRLPPGLTIYPGSLLIGAGSCQTGTPGDPLDPMTCSLGTMPPGRTILIRFDALVDPDVLPGSVLENDVLVTSDIFDLDNGDNYAHTLTAVETWADMAITKLSVGKNVTGYDIGLRRPILEDLPGQVTAGNELRYEISVQNSGPSDAQNVQILDLLPGQTDTGLTHDPVIFLRSDGADCRPLSEQQEIGVFGPGAGKFGQVLWCNFGTVPVGARRTIDIYVAVDPAVPDATTLTNGAFVWYGSSSPPAPPGAFLPFPFPQIPPELPTTDDPLLDDNFASTGTLVDAVADVFITKVDVPAEPRLDREVEPDLAIAGTEHRYLLHFGNDGPSVAQDITLQDFLDFKQFGILGEHFLRCEPFDIDDFVSCSEHNGVVDVDLLLRQNEQVIPGDVNPGDEFRFWVIVEVDEGYVLDANDFIATDDSRITTATTDYHTANNVDAHDTEIIAEADLAIEKVSAFVREPISDTVEAEGIITYTLTVRNNGPSDAAEVLLTDWLPLEGVFLDPALVQVSVSTGQVEEIGDDGRISVILGDDPNSLGVNELGRMNVGSIETVTIVVLVRNDVIVPTVVNRARVETRQNDAMWPPAPDLLPGVGGGPRTPTTDPDLGNNEDTAEVVLQGMADLRITKFGKPDGQARAGESLTYTVVVENLGPAHAHSVVVDDLLQSSGTFDLVSVASDRPATCDPASGSFAERLELRCVLSDTLEVMTPEASGRWILTVVVSADETQDIDNVATVLSADYDPDTSNNQAMVEHDITDVADLEVEKAAVGWVMKVGGIVELEDDEVTAGLSLTYTLVVTNHGPSTAENVVLKDRVPSWLEITGVAPSQGSCGIGTPEEESNLVTCYLDSLAPGASTSVLLLVDVPLSTPGGSVLKNTAFVLSDVFDPHNGDNVATNLTLVREPVPFRVYLPIVFGKVVRLLPDGPDLVVRQIEATSYGVTVTIENRGNEPIEDAFWVDAYVDPGLVPDAVNQIWSDRGSQGLVWSIGDGSLPFEPGEIRTLAVGDASYYPSLSYVVWPIPAGTPVYAQVDSVGEHAYGAVLEGHELLGGFYDNILGPVLSVVAPGSPPEIEGSFQSLGGLPARH
jgi:uncharacterized repeat protein (TIGR01451 family)/CSLREA domain-containing protein